MSIFSDYQHGYMDDFEFEQECARMNREDRYEREHLYAEVLLILSMTHGTKNMRRI